MLRRASIGIALVLMLLGAATARAQEKGQVGLVMGYPAVGVIWNLEDNFAIRTTLDFAVGSESSQSPAGPFGTFDYTTSTRGVGLGIAVLLYDKRVDSLTMYLSPSFTYRWVGSTTDGSAVAEVRTSGKSYQIGGAFGAQYAATRRFSIYGEAGVSYSHQQTDYSASTSSGYAVSARTGAGVILYF